MIIGITGYIGSGKSIVAQFFAEHGFKIINVDTLAHTLLQRDDIKGKLMAEYGLDILDRSLQIDRKKLAEHVFNDELKLHKLSTILHPELEKQAKKMIAHLIPEEKAVVDVALFEELNLNDVVDYVILVTSDLEKIYGRLEGRYTKRQIITLLNAQHLPAEYDALIENNTTLEHLKSEVAALVKKWS